MKRLKFFAGIFLLLLLGKCSTHHDRYPKELNKLVPGASLIFKAKVLLLHTLTTDEDDVTNTGVVEVIDVLAAPKSFPDIRGQQITVRFTDIKSVTTGDERMFFTDPYWVGESIGVKEIGSIKQNNNLYDNKDMASFILLARNNQDDELMRKQLKNARLVVTGRVIKISVPEVKPIATEHDPEWREAEVQIDATLKGNVEGKTLKLLFASGGDVMFYKSPKFSEGDEGVFIIPPADSQLTKLFRYNNILLEPSGFIKGKEKAAHIKLLMK